MRGVATVYRVPEIRPFLQDNARVRLGNYVANVADEMLVPMFAAVVEIDFLRSHGIARVASLSRDIVAKIGTQTPPLSVAEFDDRVVELYQSSMSFEQANIMAGALSNLAGHFNRNIAKHALRVGTNNQVCYSASFRSVVESVKKSGALSPAEFNRLLTDLELPEEHVDPLYPAETQPLTAGPFDPAPAVEIAADSAPTNPGAQSPL